MQLIAELDEELRQKKQELEASHEREVRRLACRDDAVVSPPRALTFRLPAVLQAHMLIVIAKMDEAVAKLERQVQATGSAAVAAAELVDASATGSRRRETQSASVVEAGEALGCIFTDEELAERVDQLADATELYRKAAEGDPLEDPGYEPLILNMHRYNGRCAAVHEELERTRQARSKPKQRMRFADEEGGELESGKFRASSCSYSRRKLRLTPACLLACACPCVCRARLPAHRHRGSDNVRRAAWHCEIRSCNFPPPGFGHP